MRALLMLCLLSVGCVEGTSTLLVSVSSTGVVTDVDHLSMTLTEVASNLVSKPVTVPLTGAPTTIPPVRTVALVLPSSAQGAIRVAVTSLRADGATLAEGTATAQVSPGHSSSVTVTLIGQSVEDMAVVDMLMASDLSAIDFSSILDLDVSPDLASAPDMAFACPPGAPTIPDQTFLTANCGGLDGNASDAVFVDPINGNDTTGDGTQPRPLQHLGGGAGAVALAQSHGKHEILVSMGTINETSTINLFDGLGVYGGYDAAAGWTRSDASPRPNLVVANANIAVSVAAQTMPTQWDRINVLLSSNVTTPGQSAYGMFVSSGGLFTLSNATVVASNGGPGVNSVSPSPQATPATANGGTQSGSLVFHCCPFSQADSCQAGGGGVSACTGATGNFNGGPGSDCNNGSSSGNGPAAGSAGTLGNSGGVGGPGSPGSPAPSPSPGAFGSVTAAGYSPAPGTTGLAGTPGSGGGGGGGTTNFSGTCTCGQTYTGFPGGGGGAGGCGGAPAPPPSGGGGSFALYLWNANATLRGIKLVAGNGGIGGNGAVGAIGQNGGTGNGSPAGGNGGQGGTGATSSGGAGGPSVCLEEAGTSTPTFVDTPIYVTGTITAAGGTSPSAALDGPAGPPPVAVRSN
jgi:hypothetical protein